MNDMHNFSEAKQNAIEQLREMNKKAVQTGDSPKQDTSKSTHKPLKNLPNNFAMLSSNDDMLIIGLILILSGDCRDMWLFLALMYILM